MRDEDVWFEPKRFGYGAGLPVSWKGWAVLLGYLAVTITAAAWTLPRHPLPAIAIMVVATALLFPVCQRHTRGGWRWRWGGDG